jgi:hypothetical protein
MFRGTDEVAGAIRRRDLCVAIRKDAELSEAAWGATCVVTHAASLGY